MDERQHLLMEIEQYEHDTKVQSERIKELEGELLITNMLLNTRVELLHTIPECPEHGKDCVPHAIDWVLKRKEG